MRLAIPALIVGTALALPAFAKLPAPSDDAKAKAAAAAAKTAWTDKVGAYQLCRAMERTAEYYRKSENGKQAPAAIDTPPCTDPGPFVAPPPLEAAGAHSPATMATSPPSSTATAAEQKGQPKK
ncbi:MAG TPA: hypothetical protein VNU48_02830 [Burkholderiaceae bacterium]|nr:hypothetical protein [Burkholderiaceae bacterium]